MLGVWLFPAGDGSWFRFELEPDGEGRIEVLYAIYDRRSESTQYASDDLEFISWSLSGYDVEIRFRAPGQPTIRLKGFATQPGVTVGGWFNLNEGQAERPEQLLERIHAFEAIATDQ
jgi:hypothetical protein